MRLLVNTENVQFTATTNPGPKLDNGNKQKFDRMTNLPMWTVQVMALDERGGEMLNITVVSEIKPDITVGQLLVPVELEAMPWANDRDGKVRSGVAFRATELRALTPAK
ncbi:hypothetical protein [Micromonospora sp. CPCC 206061]|uniref:hypothetical protein n=1 Tax=Micromonospora sp. CPCC 206061 TaxID=3122410 RepID=UPI002FEEE6CC